HGLPVGVARAHDAVVPGPAARDVVGGAGVAAAQAQVIVRDVAHVEDLVLVVVALHGRAAERVEGIQVELEALGRALRGVARRERDARRPFASVLGEDLDDAIVGARSIQRGRRGATNDFDVIDVIGIEVGQAVLDVAPYAEVDELIGVVVHDDAVNDVERLGAGDERAGAAQAHRDAAATRVARVLRDLRARDHALERAVRGRGVAGLDLGAAHGGDAVAEGAFLGGRGG